MILKIKTYYDKKVMKIMKVIENVMYVLKKAIAEEVVFTEEHASIKNKSWYNYMISNEKYNRYMDMTWFIPGSLLVTSLCPCEGFDRCKTKD